MKKTGMTEEERQNLYDYLYPLYVARTILELADLPSGTHPSPESEEVCMHAEIGVANYLDFLDCQPKGKAKEYITELKKASPFTFFEVLRRQVAAVYPHVGDCDHLTSLFACADLVVGRRQPGMPQAKAGSDDSS
jgi:hypothetical protein